MPKTGIVLSKQATQTVKDYLEQHKLSQETFAEEILHVSPRTLRNWLAGKTAIDDDKLELIIKTLGVGVEDFLGGEIPQHYKFQYGVVDAVFRVWKDGVAAVGESAYGKIVELFRDHVSFVRLPRSGFFQAFEHSPRQAKNYYREIWLTPAEDLDEIKFVFSFTINKFFRISYGEIILKKDTVEVVQYYQPPNYQIKRIDNASRTIKAATWLDEAPHTFVVTSDVKFTLEDKGRVLLSEDELKNAGDVAVFWRHFFFHAA